MFAENTQISSSGGISVPNREITIFQPNILGNYGKPGCTDIIRETPHYQKTARKYGVDADNIGDEWEITKQKYAFRGFISPNDPIPEYLQLGIKNQTHLKYAAADGSIGLIFVKHNNLNVQSSVRSKLNIDRRIAIQTKLAKIKKKIKEVKRATSQCSTLVIALEQELLKT